MSAQPAEASEDRLVGTVIQDRFLVLERLAAGGMGVVYKAEQVPLGRSVALKILESKHNAAVDSHFGERFFLEAAAVAQLGHPNTIVLYDYGRTEGELYYYAMEYVDGSTLTRRVHAEGPLGPQTAIHVALQICGSLREAHDAGMVHRDLKPSNVMLTRKGGDAWYVKVLDFGLVKVMGQEVGAELTKSGMLMGSPRYMAPEQVTGTGVDHRADIYAFGAVMYHALTGGPPFRQESQYEVLRAQVEQAPKPFAEVFPDHTSSVRLERLIMRCLEKEPDDRPASMNDVMSELIECAEELGVSDISLSRSCLPLTGDEAKAPPTAKRPPPRDRAIDESSAELATSAEVPRAKALTAPEAAEAKPAAEPSRSRLMLGVALVGVALLGGVIAYLIGGREPDEAPVEVVALPTDPAPAPEDTADEAPESPPVRVISDPAGARVRHGDEDLGDTPLSLHIPPGERWELTLSHDGRESRTVVASADRRELTVRLQESAEPEEDRRRRPGRRRGDARDPEPGRQGSSADQASTSPAGSDTTAPAGDTRSEGDDWGPVQSSDNRDPWAR